MTEYRKIYVKKRQFLVLVDCHHVGEEVNVMFHDLLIARNLDDVVERSGDRVVARRNVTADVRKISVPKRKFLVLAKKQNGS